MLTKRSLMLCVGAALAVAGCAEDFSSDRVSSQPTRAVQSPVERNSASGEMATLAAAEGVPLVTVGFPNKSGQAPVVRTIADAIVRPAETTKPPVIDTTTRPPVALNLRSATQPAPPATQPGVIVDPLLGPRE